MIKTEQKGKRVHLTRTSKPNFSIKTLTDEGLSSPQLFLEISSISHPQTTLSKAIKILLQEEINGMLDQISKIINDNNVNIRQAMNYVRSSILFKEIDQINTNIVNQIVGEYARNKIQGLQVALQQKTRQLWQLKNELRQEKDFNEQNLKINKVPKLDLTRQGEQSQLLCLYNKAKTSSYQAFQQLYKQRQMSNRLQFIQISNLTPKSKRQSAKLLDFKQQKKGKLMKVLTPLLNNLLEDERADLLQILKEQLTHTCPNPCCKWTQKPIQDSNRMTINSFANFTRKEIKNSSFYVSDKINQYYKRYYHHSAFDIDKIRSVTKTKTQQMEKLYKIHKSKDKFMQKKQKFRSQSTV